MKKTSIVNKIAAIVGLSLGAFALSVAAQTWTAPLQSAPDGNVYAPINVGPDPTANTPQRKLGSLTVGLGAASNVTGGLSVGGLGILGTNFVFKPVAATAVPVGSVLTAKDTGGTVEWQVLGGMQLVNNSVQSINYKATRTEYDFGTQIPPNTRAILVSISPPPSDGRILFYQGSQFIGGVGGRTGDNQSVTSAGGQLILPLVNNKISYETSAPTTKSFEFTILAIIPVKQ